MSAILYGFIATCVLVLVRRAGYVSARIAIALMLLPLLFTGRALLTGRVYGPVDVAYQSEPLASMARSAGVTSIVDPSLSDVTAQFIPWNAAVRAAIANRQWPLWNPFELGGSVLAGAAQSAPYHPLTLLSLLLPQPDGITFIAAMTYFLAALSAFLFFRTFCSSEVAALFGAIAWCFSQHIVSFILTAHGSAIAIFPLVLFGIHEVAREATARHFALLVAAMTLITLCGHPETLLHVAAIALAYTLVLTRKAGILGRVAGAALLTVLLTAVFLLPLLEAIPQTREYQDRARHEDSASRYSWPLVMHLLRVELSPGVDESAHHSAEMRHPWVGTAYAGAIVFAPALYGLWRSPGRKTWFFAAVVVFGLLAGANTPGISDLLRHLPLFGIAVNERMIAFAAFGLCALAAIGLDSWIQTPSRLDLMFIVAAVATIGLLGIGREVIPFLLAFACLRAMRSRTAATACLIALLLLQRSTEAGGMVATLDRRAFFPQFPGLELLRHDRAPFRVVGLDVLLTPNTAAEYGLEDVRGYEAMTFGRLAETFSLWSVPQAVWSNRVDDLSRPFLSLMNVRYAFVPRNALLPARWHMLAVFQNYGIAKNDAALPRAFVPSVIHVGADHDALRKIAACPDFGSEAWIETAGPSITQANGIGKVSIRDNGNRLALHASLQTSGWVVISEPFWKGWRVLLGNRRLTLHSADHAFVAFYVPRGEHDLAMEYWPPAFVRGASITLATVLGLVLFSLRIRVRNLIRVPARPAPSSYPPTLPS